MYPHPNYFLIHASHREHPQMYSWGFPLHTGFRPVHTQYGLHTSLQMSALFPPGLQTIFHPDTDRNNTSDLFPHFRRKYTARGFHPFHMPPQAFPHPVQAALNPPPHSAPWPSPGCPFYCCPLPLSVRRILTSGLLPSQGPFLRPVFFSTSY